MKKNTKILITIIVVLLVVLIGLVILVMRTNNNKNVNNISNVSSSNSQNKGTNKKEELTMNEYNSQNEKKYGEKIAYVSKYEKKTNKKLGWRLFYEDGQYAYLIADTVIIGARPFDYVDDYEDIDSMSEEGKQLNAMLFKNEKNEDRKVDWTVSMQAIAWMTDTKKWKELLDEDGKAIFAIASPTLELYVNSYNSAKEYDEYGKSDEELKEEKISLEYSERIRWI